MEEKYKHHSNPELSKAMHGIRSSSAASPHKDSRDKRARSRQASKSRDIKNSKSGN